MGRQIGAVMVTVMVAVMLVSPVQAAMVGTGEVLAGEAEAEARERLTTLMQRSEVQEQLTSLGIDPERAAERVAALSDAEVAKLEGRLQEAPAGSGVVGAVVFVFLVLLVTDILGYTDVFPFVKKAER